MPGGIPREIRKRTITASITVPALSWILLLLNLCLHWLIVLKRVFTIQMICSFTSSVIKFWKTNWCVKFVCLDENLHTVDFGWGFFSFSHKTNAKQKTPRKKGCLVLLIAVLQKTPKVAVSCRHPWEWLAILMWRDVFACRDPSQHTIGCCFTPPTHL